MAITLYNILIFDIYNLWYRAIWKHDSLTKIDNKMLPIDGICNFFSILNSYIKKFGTKDCRCYFLFDNAKSTILRNRKLLDEDYKKNRKEMPQEFYDALNLIELILKFYRDNSCVYRKQNVEGDDFVLPIINSYIKEHDKILLFSTDMDWSRALLNDKEKDINVAQYTRNNEIFTTKNFEEKFGFKPTVTNITFYKTFYGDSSDNIIPTLNNYPKEYFLDCIFKYTHVNFFIEDVLNGRLKYLDKGWVLKVKESAERMRLNWNLISSDDISITDLENWKIECSYKPNKLLIIYNTLNVIGKFDERIKNENKESDIWNMLNGELLNRAN